MNVDMRIKYVPSTVNASFAWRTTRSKNPPSSPYDNGTFPMSLFQYELNNHTANILKRTILEKEMIDVQQILIVVKSNTL